MCPVRSSGINRTGQVYGGDPVFSQLCRMGDTPEETIAILESVVAATILTYQERGYALPPGVMPLETDAHRSSQPSVREISV